MDDPRIRSDEDGWIDLGEHVGKLVGGEEKAGFNRPNLTDVGGMATEEGTQGAFAGDVRFWWDARVQTLVGGIHAGAKPA